MRFGQVANFKTNSKIPIDKFSLAINSRLKKSIVIKSAEEVDERFHSRYLCKQKTYRYIINNSEHGSAIYRNQEYSSSATNIAQGYELVRDEDGAWYKLYTQSPYYEFQYNVRTLDTYVLVVDYPEVYKSYLEYTGVPENIEVAIYSEQKS